VLGGPAPTDLILGDIGLAASHSEPNSLARAVFIPSQ
jgi:hypothetical protein